MTTQTTVPPEAPEAGPRTSMPSGPGAQLRQARLDLKLAPEDVAGILHLSPRQIVALESDDYANLPGPTYVRGYLRGYAQLLGLSAEPIVETYNRSIAARKPVDLGKLAPKPEIRSDHQLVKFATIGVAALILGLSAVWWQEQDEPVAPVATHEVAPEAVETQEPAPEVTSSVDVSARREAPTAPTTSPQGGGASGKPAAIVPVARERAPAPVAVAPSTVTPPPRAEDGAAPAQPVATGPRGRLIIQAAADSWADVRDANGTRLVYEIIPAGRIVTVEGVAPLAVFLGNADEVRVEYNGEVYDTTRHRRGDIARFTLGESPGTQ